MSNLEEQLRSLSPAKRALYEQLSRQKPRAPESIAIVGIGCRFPGGVVDLASYWALLKDGKSGVTEVPASRWNAGAYYAADPDATGKSVSRWGGFLSSVDLFDADLFGITPRQAAYMDPQHRILLEVAFEALEDAAMPPLDLAGTRGGVFVGISYSDYALLHLSHLQSIDAMTAPGLGLHGAAGRLSHAFGLEGPSLAVDTACSSSLVAVHLACQSLRQSEVDLALAGGVNLILSPASTVALSKLRMLAPDGRCKPFDARADGYVRSEGCGVLVLKRLADAVAAGNRVLAVIRGSAVNQDGRASGYAVPSGFPQRAVIRAALENAGLASADVGYVETHGTGTAIGDAVEAEALADVFGRSRRPSEPLMVGAVKSNLGHLESAAGMAALIKAVLAIRHGEVPRNLHLEALHPDILRRKAPMVFPQDHTAWPNTGRPRVAGVSAFGIPGTNAHVVVAEAPPPADAAPVPPGEPALVVLSAQNEQAISAHAQRLHEALGQDPSASLHDLALTSTAGRSHLPCRLALCARGVAELQEGLGELLSGRSGPGRRSGRAQATPARVAFVFSGEAAEPPFAGRALYERHAKFRGALDRLAEIVRPWLGAPLTEVLWGGPAGRPWPASAIAPALLALELGLLELWRSFGTIPDFVGGYGAGEYAAACAAGVMDPVDALILVRERARLWELRAAELASLLVHATAARLSPMLVGGLALTADEGSCCVVGGPQGEVAQLAAALEKEGIRASPAPGPLFHPSVSAAVADELAPMAKELGFRAPAIRLFSTTSRVEVPTGEAPGVAHWVAHAQEPVRLSSTLAAICAKGAEVFVELGAGAPLSRRLAPHLQEAWIPTLRQGGEDGEVFLEAVGSLFARGAIVDLQVLGRPPPTRASALPTYPFQRKRYWLDLPPSPPNGVPAARARVRRDVREELARLGAEERPAHLHEYVAAEVAWALGSPARVLGDDEAFSEVGLDSNIAMDLLAALRRELRLELPDSLLYTCPTLGALARYLEREVLGGGGVTPVREAALPGRQSPGGSPDSPG